jgi:hypothetical protein
LLAFADMCAAAGIKTHQEISEDLILRRNQQGKLQGLVDQLIKIPPGSLLSDQAEHILDEQMLGLGKQWHEAQPNVW